MVDKRLDDLEQMPAFQVGLWYSPYVKIYSIGGRNRVAEISNYPRAYKDTTPHVYTEDILFIVTEGDLNWNVEIESFYRDSKDKLFSIGEQATHYKGDGLPGAFPLWLESESLPFAELKHEFPLSDVPGPIKNLSEAQQTDGATFEKLPDEVVATMKGTATKIVLSRKPTDSDKQIIRIRYQRVF